MMARARWMLLTVLALSGCATGFDRAALQTRMQNDSLQVTDESISQAQKLQPQLHFPCRIAVYLKPNSHADWRWSGKDKAVLESWASALKKEAVASDLFLLPDMLTGKGELKELRFAAAQCGADALLIIHGAAQTDSYLNPAAVFNLTVVGGYIIPGSHRDALFMIEGCVIDPHNGYIYAGVQAEGEGAIIRPTFIIEEKDAIARAKSQALDRFGPELVQRIRNLAAR